MSPNHLHRAALLRVADGKTISNKMARELETHLVVVTARNHQTFRIKGGGVALKASGKRVRELHTLIVVPTELGLTTIRAMLDATARTTAQGQDQTPVNYVPLRTRATPRGRSTCRLESPLTRSLSTPARSSRRS